MRPDPAVPVGAYVLDGRDGRVGQVMGHEGGRVRCARRAAAANGTARRTNSPRHRRTSC